MPPEQEPGALTATAGIVVCDGRLTWSSRPPVVLRRTGRRRLHLVQVGGGPLGGDALGLEVDVGRGEELAIRTAAATVVQRGPSGGTASFALRVRLAPGAHLCWWPEPCVVTAAARWSSTTRVDMAPGARLCLGEQFVLGRHGQRGGRLRSEVVVDLDGRPLLATTTEIDDSDPAHRGPGGTGGARSIGTVVGVGPGVDRDERAGEAPGVVWSRSPLEGPGAVSSALGSPSGVTTVLAREHHRCPRRGEPPEELLR